MYKFDRDPLFLTISCFSNLHFRNVYGGFPPLLVHRSVNATLICLELLRSVPRVTNYWHILGIPSLLRLMYGHHNPYPTNRIHLFMFLVICWTIRSLKSWSWSCNRMDEKFNEKENVVISRVFVIF